MSRNLSALIFLTVVFSGSVAFGTQSVEAKTYELKAIESRSSAVGSSELNASDLKTSAAKTAELKTAHNSSHKSRNYFVPPPPPYTPSMIPSALGMTYAVDADDVFLKKSVIPYNKYLFTRHVDSAHVVQPNPFVSFHPGVETKIQKQIDYFDSEIDSTEKEIGKLLNL